jgi:hypothetical protein
MQLMKPKELGKMGKQNQPYSYKHNETGHLFIEVR